MKSVPSKFAFSFLSIVPLSLSNSAEFKISYVMSKTSQSNPRIELLKQLKSNVNSFAFTPTESKRKAVESSIEALRGFIEAVEVVAEKRKAKPKASKSKRKPKATKAVKRPKRTSEAGLELAQAKTATANRVGKVKKTKVVHAITEGDAMPFEPRKEVPVVEPKARKKQQMLTLLEGETPQEAMARHRSAQIEAERIEAEALIADTAPNMMEPSFAPAV